jgi:hypothetical protein
MGHNGLHAGGMYWRGYNIFIITTPIFPALKNYCKVHRGSYFLEVPADILNSFWVQVAVSVLKTLHGGFRSKTAVI